MKSKDLAHWETVGYVFDKLTDNPKYDLLGGTVYGRGQWASSIRYHNGRFYVLFSPNDEPYKSYLYTAENPAGKWELVSRMKHFHDASLFFDDDGRIYVFYGTGELQELKSDLSGVKPDGINRKLFERDAEEYGLLEGSQALKHNGRYYLLMISMVWDKPGRVRRQVCYRADNITGPYEKKVILEHDFDGYGGVGQGCITDSKEGNWYGVIFQDREGVGRIPMLMPCRWIDGWPMLGDEKGEVPLTMTMTTYPEENRNGILGSDDFSSKELSLYWQWNHNPENDNWSLTERPGYLRLKTGRVVDNVYLAPNTITQRMGGPACKAVISMDVSKMKEGDVAGFSAFNGHSGLLSVVKDSTGKHLAMSTNIVHFTEKDKAVARVDIEEKARIEFTQDVIYLRIDCDFTPNKDIAAFYYSLDNKNWEQLGTDFKMLFDYTRLFMGSKFAIFNYATKSPGGYVDIDFFSYAPSPPPNPLKGGLRGRRRCQMSITPAQAERSPGFTLPSPYLNCEVVQPTSGLMRRESRSTPGCTSFAPGLSTFDAYGVFLAPPLGGWGVDLISLFKKVRTYFGKGPYLLKNRYGPFFRKVRAFFFNNN
jgi:beta-xylosidase